MKRKSILLRGTKTVVGEADRRILDSYLTNYEIHELPKDEAAYSLTDDDGFDIAIELFGQQYQLEVYPNELRTDDFQNAINGKLVKMERKSSCTTFKGVVKGTNREVRLSINEYGISGFIQLEDQKLFVTKSIKFNLSGGRPTLFVAYYEQDIVDKEGSYCGVTSEMERRFLDTLPKPSDSGHRSIHCRFLKIATDADFAFFQIYGSNTNAEILDIINLIEGVYIDTFDVLMRVTFQNVWTTNDPYTGDPLTIEGSWLLVNELRNYWQANFIGVDRDVVHLFTGVNAFVVNGAYGIVFDIGTICAAPADSYGLTRERFQQFLTTAHEIGHNFGGIHEDGINCKTTTASIMCQGDKQIPMYFSAASITRMGNFINANSGCLNPSLYFRILGDPFFCNSSVYTVSNLRPTETTVWSVTPTAAATITGSGNSRTVTRSGAFNGPFTLLVEITTDCGTVNISRLLYAGAITGHFIDGPINVQVNAQELYWAENPTPTDFIAWNWEFLDIPPGGATITPVFPWYAEIEFHSPAANGDYILILTLTNECGISQGAPLLIHVDDWSAEWGFDLDRSRSGEKVVVSIKPNDSGELLVADKTATPTFKATVYNRENYRLLDGESENGELVFETRDLPNGVYIIHIQQDRGDVVKRAFHIDR